MDTVTLIWMIAGMAVSFFGGMMVGYVMFSPKFERNDYE